MGNELTMEVCQSAVTQVALSSKKVSSTRAATPKADEAYLSTSAQLDSTYFLSSKIEPIYI